MMGTVNDQDGRIPCTSLISDLIYQFKDWMFGWSDPEYRPNKSNKSVEQVEQAELGSK
jgi:hypothetical protein